MWVYRCAKDRPEDVKKNGFKPWLEKQGRWDSSKAAKLLEDYFDGKTLGHTGRKSPLDFSRYIISSTKGDTVSTAKDRHCAGQGHQRGGHTYKIYVKDSLIHRVPWTVVDTEQPIKMATLGINPNLYLNTGCNDPAHAKIILVVHKGEERTFLTKIPAPWVRFYQLHGENIRNESNWHELWRPAPKSWQKVKKPKVGIHS